MADEKGVQLPIKSSFDPKGTDDAAKGLNKTEDAAKGLEGSAEKTTEALKGMAEAMGLLLGAAEVIAFLKESTEEFYENERAIRGVGVAANAYGADVVKVKKAVEEWAEAMSRLSGISDNELMRAVGEQYMLTGSLKQAYSRVSLAMDYATATGVKFAQGMDVVSAAVLGKTRSLVGVVPGITRQTEATEASAKAIAFLEGKIRGATTAIHDNALAADQAKARWEMFKESIGGVVAPAITAVRDGLVMAKDAVILMGKELVEWFSTMGQSVAAFASFVKNVFTGSGSLTSEWKKYKDETAKIDAEHAIRSQKIQDDAVKHYLGGLSEEVEAHKKAGEQKIKSELEVADKTLKVTNTLALQIEQTWKSHALKYVQNQQLMAAEGKKLADQGMLNVAKMTAIEEEAHKKRLEMAKEYQATKRALAKQELAMQMELANASIALLSGVFGESKELAIAQAIINTYQGATQALAQGGIYGAVLAAVVIAAGLAQVAKIESTEPATNGMSTQGSGFDDPSNDQAARQGGRRWAGDMIREFTSGVSQGWAEGMRGGASTVNNVDNSRRTTINASIQDPSNIESVKKLIRTIKMVDSNVLGQTTIAARTR